MATVLDERAVTVAGVRRLERLTEYVLPPHPKTGAPRSMVVRHVVTPTYPPPPRLDPLPPGYGAPLRWDTRPCPPAVTRLVGYGPGMVPPYRARLVRLDDAPIPRRYCWRPKVGEATAPLRARCALLSRCAGAAAGSLESERVGEWWEYVAATAHHPKDLTPLRRWRGSLCD